MTLLPRPWVALARMLEESNKRLKRLSLRPCPQAPTGVHVDPIAIVVSGGRDVAMVGSPRRVIGASVVEASPPWWRERLEGAAMGHVDVRGDGAVVSSASVAGTSGRGAQTCRMCMSRRRRLLVVMQKCRSCCVRRNCHVILRVLWPTCGWLGIVRRKWLQMNHMKSTVRFFPGYEYGIFPGGIWTPFDRAYSPQDMAELFHPVFSAAVVDCGTRTTGRVFCRTPWPFF